MRPTILLSVAAFAACQAPFSPPPSAERTALPVPDTFVAKPAVKDPGRVQDDWLSTFGDARLDALVAEAQQKNADLMLAAARRDRALAEAGKADAALAPKVDAVAGAGRQGSDAATANRFDLGLKVNWEIDVWGRLSAGAQAAALDAVAAAADYEFARQSLAARTAEAWFFAIAGKQLAALDGQLLTERERVERITVAHFDVGEARQLDLDLVQGQTASAREALAGSRGACDAAARALEAVLGRYPGNEIEVATGLPAMPPAPPTGLPSELLERRPDVVAADRRVAAAFQRVGAARAAKLPRLSLTLGGGTSSSELGALLDPKQAVWNLGANLLGPLFDGGELEAQTRIAQANEQEALANYVKVAQRGFLEVETALANERVLRQRLVELTEAERRLLRARTAGEVRYAEGEMSIFDLDQLYTDHARAARGLLQVQQELLQQRLALHLALGGSFAATPATEAKTKS